MRACVRVDFMLGACRLRVTESVAAWVCLSVFVRVRVLSSVTLFGSALSVSNNVPERCVLWLSREHEM